MASIGIDIGTTKACVAVYRNHHVEVIPYNSASTTPAIITFNESLQLVGEVTQHESVEPFSTLFAIKRIIGRKLNDKELQRDVKKKRWPFTVFENESRLKIEVKMRDEQRVVKKDFYPEEIMAMLIRKMIQVAEAHLGEQVARTVISVPAFFTDAQRQATLDAAAITGIQVLQLINEPTAAAIAYNFKQNESKKRNVLVFDLGGGCLDVSVFAFENDKIRTRSTTGDTHLGGEDFTYRLVQQCIKEFKQRYPKLSDIENNHKAMRCLMIECEKAKKALSQDHITNVKIDFGSLHGEATFSLDISRDKFNELCKDLFELTIKKVKKVLENCSLKKEAVDEVVLVGGSCKMPNIQQLLREFFEKDLTFDLNLEEAVVKGAAIQAASIRKNNVLSLVKEVSTYKIAITSDCDSQFKATIQPNSRIPYKKEYNLNTNGKSKIILDAQVKSTDHGHRITQLELVDVTPETENVLLVTVEIDLNGILHVGVTDKQTNKVNLNSLLKNGLCSSSINRCRKEAEEYNEREKNLQKCLQARNFLETRCNQAREHVKKIAEQFILENSEKINETLAWLKDNRNSDPVKLNLKCKELDDEFEKLDAITKIILNFNHSTLPLITLEASNDVHKVEETEEQPTMNKNLVENSEINFKFDFVKYCNQIMLLLKESGNELGEAERHNIERVILDEIYWIEEQNTLTKENFETRRNEFKNRIRPDEAFQFLRLDTGLTVTQFKQARLKIMADQRRDRKPINERTNEDIKRTEQHFASIEFYLKSTEHLNEIHKEDAWLNKYLNSHVNELEKDDEINDNERDDKSSLSNIIIAEYVLRNRKFDICIVFNIDPEVFSPVDLHEHLVKKFKFVRVSTISVLPWQSITDGSFHYSVTPFVDCQTIAHVTAKKIMHGPIFNILYSLQWDPLTRHPLVLFVSLTKSLFSVANMSSNMLLTRFDKPTLVYYSYTFSSIEKMEEFFREDFSSELYHRETLAINKQLYDLKRCKFKNKNEFKNFCKRNPFDKTKLVIHNMDLNEFEQFIVNGQQVSAVTLSTQQLLQGFLKLVKLQNKAQTKMWLEHLSNEETYLNFEETFYLTKRYVDKFNEAMNSLKSAFRIQVADMYLAHNSKGQKFIGHKFEPDAIPLCKMFISPGDLDLLEAFSHFTYIKSDQQLLIIDLKPELWQGVFMLTEPLIFSHQIKQFRSPSNLGSQGIEYFLENHDCRNNPICSKFIKQDKTLN